MRRLRVFPEAERDVDAAAEHYLHEEGLELALRFYEAVELTYEAILAHPHAAPTVKTSALRIQGLRFRLVRSFGQYLVFYRAEGDAVDIVRVLHGARDVAPLLGADPTG